MSIRCSTAFGCSLSSITTCTLKSDPDIGSSSIAFPTQSGGDLLFTQAPKCSSSMVKRFSVNCNGAVPLSGAGGAGVNIPLIGDAEGLSLRLCDRLSAIDAPCAPRVDLRLSGEPRSTCNLSGSVVVLFATINVILQPRRASQPATGGRHCSARIFFTQPNSAVSQKLNT